MKENEIDCYDCENCFDSGDFVHFKRCREEGVCVDCEPLACKGEKYKKKGKK